MACDWFTFFSHFLWSFLAISISSESYPYYLGKVPIENLKRVNGREFNKMTIHKIVGRMKGSQPGKVLSAGKRRGNCFWEPRRRAAGEDFPGSCALAWSEGAVHSSSLGGDWRTVPPCLLLPSHTFPLAEPEVTWNQRGWCGPYSSTWHTAGRIRGAKEKSYHPGLHRQLIYIELSKGSHSLLCFLYICSYFLILSVFLFWKVCLSDDWLLSCSFFSLSFSFSFSLSFSLSKLKDY